MKYLFYTDNIWKLQLVATIRVPILAVKKCHDFSINWLIDLVEYGSVRINWIVYMYMLYIYI